MLHSSQKAGHTSHRGYLDLVAPMRFIAMMLCSSKMQLCCVVALTAWATVAGAQDTRALRQPVEIMDANRLVSIAEATALPNGMKPSRQLNSIVSQLRQGNISVALEDWKGFIVVNRQPGGQNLDLNALIQWILRESYLATSADLRHTAEKLKYFNDLKKQLRDEIRRARADLGEERPWPRDRRVVVFRQNFTGAADPVEREEKRWVDKQGLSKILEEYDRLLQTVDNDAQLANVDMQSTLQKQQQTLQMMSQISKQLNDTALAVIRNLGG